MPRNTRPFPRFVLETVGFACLLVISVGARRFSLRRQPSQAANRVRKLSTGAYWTKDLQHFQMPGTNAATKTRNHETKDVSLVVFSRLRGGSWSTANRNNRVVR